MLDAIWSVILELAPWLLLGAIVAGLLHGLLPPGFIGRHLGGKGGIWKAVLLGVPLPLCSCGVIPAGLGLKRDGASDGASVGFLISTPQTGVDSVLVSAAMLGWPFALFKVLSAGVTGLIGGGLTNVVSPPNPNGPDSLVSGEGGKRPGWRQMVAHGVDLIRMIWRWLLFGVLVSAAITVFVPTTFFQGISAQGDLVVMGAVLLMSVPMYVCATASVPIAAALVAGGLPAGAALVFLMAGPATNVATIGAIMRGFGKKIAAIYLSTIVVGSVGFGLLFDSVINIGAIEGGHHEHGAPWWSVVCAVILMGMVVWFAGEDMRGLIKKFMAKGGDAQTVEVAVEGMNCGGCSSKLERALMGLDGVQAAEVTLEPGRAVVTGAATLDQVVAAVSAAGFKPITAE